MSTYDRECEPMGKERINRVNKGGQRTGRWEYLVSTYEEKSVPTT